jgi:hypothetical protein
VTGERRPMREMGTTCSLCAAPARFFMHKNGCDVYSCTECGLAFVHPVPMFVIARKR